MSINSYQFKMRENADEFGVEEDLPFGRRNIDFSFDINNDVTWQTILNNFLNFLSSVYGYDIREELKKKGLE